MQLLVQVRKGKNYTEGITKKVKKYILKQARNFLFLFSKEKADKNLPVDVNYYHVPSPNIKIEEQDLKALDRTMLLPSRH